MVRNLIVWENENWKEEQFGENKTRRNLLGNVRRIEPLKKIHTAKSLVVKSRRPLLPSKEQCSAYLGCRFFMSSDIVCGFRNIQ